MHLIYVLQVLSWHSLTLAVGLVISPHWDLDVFLTFPIRSAFLPFGLPFLCSLTDRPALVYSDHFFQYTSYTYRIFSVDYLTNSGFY